jgi:rhomboid protease GluP
MIWRRVRATWLSHQPDRNAGLITAIVTLLLVLGSVMFHQDFLHASQWMPASHESIYDKHQLWRLWTTLFAHADIAHLLSNSLLFFILGYFLIGYFGAFVFPIAAFAFGGLTNLIVLKTYPSQVDLIGVSGVVYWMAGAWLALYFALDRKRSYAQRGLRITGVALGIFMPASAFDPAISYAAHFVGFLIGILFGVIFYFWNRSKFLKALIIEDIIEDPETEIPMENTNSPME